MGKQINYALDYKSFLKVAQKALDLGCQIIRNEHAATPPLPCKNLSIVDESCFDYYFCLPQHPPLKYLRDRAGLYCINYDDNARICLIEAGFAPILDNQMIGGNRMYIATGYYDEEGQWIPRSDEATRIYDTLARLAGKLAPYHSFTLNDGIIIKERVSHDYLNLIENEGYQLQIIDHMNRIKRSKSSPEDAAERMQQMKNPENYRPISDHADQSKLVNALGKETVDFLSSMGAIVFTPPEKK